MFQISLFIFRAIMLNQKAALETDVTVFNVQYQLHV